MLYKKSIFVLSIIALLASCQTDAMLEKKYPPIGEMIDVNDKSAHVRIIEGSDPTVLFFSDIDMLVL